MNWSIIFSVITGIYLYNVISGILRGIIMATTEWLDDLKNESEKSKSNIIHKTERTKIVGFVDRSKES